MPLPFREIYDRWERSKSFGDPRDINTFSSDMNDVTGTNDFDPGKTAGWWTRTSTAADKYFFEPIARESGLEYAGRKIGGLFGQPYEELGAEVARSLPRTVAQTLPLVAAEVLSGGTATPLVLGAGAAATGGLFGAQTYAETGSPQAAALSGVTAAALPSVGKFGGKILTKAIGPEVEEVAGKIFPKAVGDTAKYKATQLLGSQAAMISTMQGSQAGQAAILGIPYNPFSPDFWAQQIPYTLFDILRTAKPGGVPTAAEARARLPKVELPPTKPTIYVPPEGTPESKANAAALLDKISALAKDVAATPEQKAAAFTEGLTGVQNPKFATQQKPEGLVSLTGRYKELENGNLKMLVTNVEGMDLPEHANVFVNVVKGQGQYRVDPGGEARTIKITIPRKFVGTNVEYPLTHAQFGIQPGQVGLKPTEPVAGAVVPEENLLSLRQKAQQTIGNEDVFKAALTKEPKEETEALGYWRNVIDKMTPEHLKPGAVSPFAEPAPAGALSMDERMALQGEKIQVLPDDVPDAAPTHAAMKTEVQNLEQAKVEAAKTVENINKIPTSPQDIPDLLPPDPKPQLDLELKAGHTPTQAVEKVRLQTQTPIVDEQLQIQKLAREQLIALSRRTIKPVETKAGLLKDEHDAAYKFDLPHEADEFLDQYKARNPDDPLDYRVQKMRGKYYLRVKKREVGIERIRPTEVAEGVEGVADPAEQAADLIDRDFLDPEVMADLTREEAITSAAQEHEGASQQADPYARPEVSREDYLRQLDLAASNPRQAMHAGGFADLPDTILALRQARAAFEPLSQGKTDLKSINAALEANGVRQLFANESEMRRTFGMVRDGLDDFTRRTRSFTLDSEVPHDPELVRQIGIQGPNGLANFLNWYVDNQPDGALRELAEGLRKYSDFSHIDLTYEPKGWWYDRAENTGTGRPRINIGYLPGTAEDAVSNWGARGVLQEIAHDTTASLMYRTDPAAVNFKAELTRILDTVRKSNRIPVEVRKALDKSIKEDWYGEWSRGSLKAPIPMPVVNVAGRKGVLLKIPEVNRVVESFSKNQTITDAFGGSGQLSHFAKGAGAKNVTLNIREPRMRAVFEEIKSNPEDFAQRVAKAVEPIKSNREQSTPTLADGSPVRPYLDNLERTDPNVALFIKQNLNAQGREVATTAFTPTKMLSSVGLRDLPNRIRQVSQAIDGISGEDGWDIVRQTKSGQRRLVDPPYVGQGGYGEKPVTVEEQLANYEKNLFPAAEKGGKFVVFDIADDRLMQALQDHGFNVAEVQRSSRGQAETRPELMAWNHEKPTGRIYGYSERSEEPVQDIYDRYNSELPGRESWWSAFYSLQNEHELIGGIFGDPALIRLLQDVKMPKTQTPVLNFFANVWARMFGYSPNAENAFARLLGSYDNYLSGTRMSRAYNGMSYVRDMLIARGVKPEALASRMDTIYKTYGQGDLRPSVEGFEREMKAGLLPATAVAGDLNPQFRDAIMTGDAKAIGNATSDLLVGELPQHQELWVRLKEDLQIAKALYGEAKKGTVPAEFSLFQEGLNAENAKLNAMKRALDKQATAVERWNSMDSLGNSDGIKRLWSGTLKGEVPAEPSDPTGNEDVARQALGLESKGVDYITAERRRIAATGEKIPWLDRMFKFATFTSEEHPGFKPVFQTMSETQADAHRRMTELNVARDADPQTKTVTREVADANHRVRTTPGLNQIGSDMLRRAQVLEKMGKPVTFDDPEMQTALRRASDAKRRNGRSDRDDVITAFNSEANRSQHRVDSVIPEHFTRTNRDLTALVIMGREIGMPFTRAEELSNQLYGALAMLRDPKTAAQGAETMRAVAAGMQPDTFARTLQKTTEFISSAEKVVERSQKYRHYIGEQRYGKFHLVMTRDGEPYRASFDSEKAARAEAKKLATDGWVLQDIVPKSQANVEGFISGTEPLVRSMEELDQQNLRYLEDVIKDLPLEKQAALRPLVQRAADYRSSSAAFSPVPTQASPRRQFRAGRESLDMFANADEETGRFVNWMRHRESRIRTAAQMLDPELLGNRPLREYSQDFVDGQLSADNPIARRLSEATFYWNLAGNFGVDFLHAIQSLTTGMASVISETGGVGDAMKYVMGASSKVFKRYTTGKWSDPKTQYFIDWMTKRGGLGLPTWNEVFDPSAMNYFRGNGPESLFGKTMNAIKYGVRGYKGIFLKHNDMVGGLAGFQLGLDRGMSLEDAARFGEGVKNRGFYSAGKIQRSVGAWNVKEKAIPQLMFSLRTYTMGWFSQLSHNWKVGFGNVPGEYSPAQRQGAKNAFLYMLGAQATLAGALGLPGVGQGLALLKQATGVDLKGWTRKNLAAMFGEDQDDYGGLLTGMALHGLVAQFAPFDPSGRHIPNFPFIGVTPQKGFDITSLIPAPFTTASDMVNGIMSVARGEDPTRGLPQTIRGPVHLWMGEGDVRNSRGELIYKLSPSERFITGLGLEPSRIAAAKETAATVDQLNQQAARKRQSEIDQVAALYRKNDISAAQRLMGEIAQKNPTYDMAAFVRSVSSSVERQTFAYDWKREVNPAVDIVGLSSNVPSQELDRRRFRTNVQSSLGLLPPLTPWRGDMRAASIDDLMNSNPYVTRAQALRTLQATLPSRRRSAFSLPEEYQ